MMNKAMLGLAALVVVGGGSAAEVGQPAPAFTASDTNGRAHSLADAKGKYVVLEWTNYDCPFVRKHYGAGQMQKLQKEFTGKGVIWYSVNSSAPGKQGNYAPEKWNEMLKEKGAASTAHLLDPDGTVGKAYGAQTTPHVFVIDPAGVLIYAGAIDDKPDTNPASIGSARNYVRAALEAAMSGKAVEPAKTKSYGCSVKY